MAGLLEHHGGGVVRHGPDHVQMTGKTGQIATQVRQCHEGVAQQPQALPHQVDQALILPHALFAVLPGPKHRKAESIRLGSTLLKK